MNDGKSLSVVAVGVCAELMFYLVALEVRNFADFQDPVFRHGGGPHQLASRIVVFVIAKQNTDITDHTSHNRFAYIIGQVIIVRFAEVGFHRVTECVERS